MLVVETIARIRREYFVKGKSIKEIVRDLKVSRNTVRKVLRSGATAFSYERAVQLLPKLGRWKDELDRLLAANEAKPGRERLTLIRLFEELRTRGYTGGYDAVRRYARAWRKGHAGASVDAYVPLSFAPGEAYQFDWSHEIVLLNGTTATVKVAHLRLCHSRMFFVRAYPRETQEMVFDAHDRAFAFFKGACRRGLYDNMKTAVETVFIGKDRVYNRRFLQMCGHYLLEPVACTPAAGWETRLRRQWFAKRKSIVTLLREVLYNEPAPLLDSDADNKALDTHAALQELGGDHVGFGYFTATVTVWDGSRAGAAEKVRAVERVINGRGFTTIRETVNAVEVWLGNSRQPQPPKPHALEDHWNRVVSCMLASNPCTQFESQINNPVNPKSILSNDEPL